LCYHSSILVHLFLLQKPGAGFQPITPAVLIDIKSSSRESAVLFDLT